MRVCLVFLVAVLLSGCVVSKAIHVCLADADSEFRFQAPSSIVYGLDGGSFTLQGRGCYCSTPMIADTGQKGLFEKMDGLPSCGPGLWGPLPD